MTSKPSEELLAAISSTLATPNDKLDALRLKAAAMRDLDAEIQSLEERLDTMKEQRTLLMTKTLPDMMDAAGVPAIELDAIGNMPAVRVAMTPYYSANIAASWPSEKREAAFQWLDSNGQGDLIKTVITLEFPRSHRAQARDAIDKLKKHLHLTPDVKESVHAQTLTAWLRETIEEGHAMPPLDVIGGSVGRVVKMKPLKVK